MAEAKVRNEWSHTSNLMALIANVNRSKKSKVFKPSDFNPLEMAKSKEVIHVDKSNIGILKKAFTGA